MIALRPNEDLRGGKANYVATLTPKPAFDIAAKVRKGNLLYVGDIGFVDGVREAFQSAQKEQGREASELRAAIAKRYNLPNLARSIKYKSAAVNMIQRGEAKFSKAQQSIPGAAQPPAQPPRQGKMPLQGGQPGNRASWDSPEPSMFDDLVYKLQD